MIRTGGRAAIVVAALLAAAACGGGGTTSPSAGTSASGGVATSAAGGSGSPAASASGPNTRTAGPSGSGPIVTPEPSGSPGGSVAPSASGSPATSASPAATGSPAATASASPSAATSPSPSAGAGEFINPVLKGNFADPHVIAIDGVYHAYATGNLTNAIQYSTSKDLITWTPTDEALTRRPFWQPSSNGLTWAPEVAQTSAGFVMYYTARDVAEGKQCLAVAVAPAPEGPFEDRSEKPFLCQYDLGGSIDPSPFTDTDGKRYLLWKNDGNCCGIRTKLYMQQLSDDGLELVGEAKDLGVENDRPWERNLIEGPNLILQDGTYYLFFSANDYNSRNYAAGYATSKKLFGPYKDAEENPILVSDETAAGPGGQTMVEVEDGEWWVLYHAWDTKRVGDQIGGERSMWLDELVFEDGKVRVEGPDVGPQPAPLGP